MDMYYVEALKLVCILMHVCVCVCVCVCVPAVALLVLWSPIKLFSLSEVVQQAIR